MWGNFRPDADTSEAEKSLRAGVHSKKKVVFSSQAHEDGNALFIFADIPAKVAEMEQQVGKEIWLYGGAGLITTFIQHGLIDQ